MIKKQSTSHAQ